MIPHNDILPRDHPLKRAVSLALAGALGFGLGVWATRSGRRAGGGRPGSREPLERFDPEVSQAYMRRAIANARGAAIDKRTGGPFGAVIVDRDGAIVGEGANHFDDSFLYNELTLPASARKIPTAMMLRDEALEVWREYAAQPDNTPY